MQSANSGSREHLLAFTLEPVSVVYLFSQCLSLFSQPRTRLSMCPGGQTGSVPVSRRLVRHVPRTSKPHLIHDALPSQHTMPIAIASLDLATKPLCELLLSARKEASLSEKAATSDR
jgi:hypothetical protein